MNTTISLRVKESDKKKLDRVARAQDRDRSYVIKEAIDLYLDLYQEKITRIKNAQKQVENGDVCNEKEWRKVFKK